MKVTEGINWIVTCTGAFEETVAFFRDVMRLAVTEEGVPVTDTQFTRYVQIKMPNGVMLEIVNPNETVRQFYVAPICFNHGGRCCPGPSRNGSQAGRACGTDL